MTDFTVDVLGSSNAWAAPGAATSGYLVRSDSTGVLLDCGHGVLGKLRAVAQPQDLTAVVLSHLHADHSADMIALAYCLRYHPHERMGHRPLLIVPEGGAERLAAIGEAFGSGGLFAEQFVVEEVADGTTAAVGDLALTFGRVPHPLPTNAVDVRATSGRRVTYSADCGPNDTLERLAADTDLLLIEATMPESSDDHLSAFAAGEIARRANASVCGLVHVCDAFDEQWVLEQGAAGFSAPVKLVKSGDRFVV